MIPVFEINSVNSSPGLFLLVFFLRYTFFNGPFFCFLRSQLFFFTLFSHLMESLLSFRSFFWLLREDVQTKIVQMKQRKVKMKHVTKPTSCFEPSRHRGKLNCNKNQLANNNLPDAHNIGKTGNIERINYKDILQ